MSPVELPARYHRPWRQPFEEPILERMAPGRAVLDIGSGRHPAITPERRPEGVPYVGLDLSAEELAAAGPGAYTETVTADATEFRPELAGRFDLAISWQVLEHVPDLAATVSNVKRYLEPRGEFVALFSGSWSAFGVINRALPDRVGSRLVDRVMKRSANNLPVFPAFYDRCTVRGFRPLFAEWRRLEVTPLYNGAGYFGFAAPLQRAYLAYENAIAARRVANLATHYLIRAVS